MRAAAGSARDGKHVAGGAGSSACCGHAPYTGGPTRTATGRYRSATTSESTRSILERRIGHDRLRAGERRGPTQQPPCGNHRRCPAGVARFRYQASLPAPGPRQRLQRCGTSARHDRGGRCTQRPGAAADVCRFDQRSSGARGTPGEPSGVARLSERPTTCMTACGLLPVLPSSTTWSGRAQIRNPLPGQRGPLNNSSPVRLDSTISCVKLLDVTYRRSSLSITCAKV